MKAVEENMEDFDEISVEQETKKQLPGNGTTSNSRNRPDLRVVQIEVDRDGKTQYKNVGGMWKNVSRNGKEFYTLLIGSLKLLVFHNVK